MPFVPTVAPAAVLSAAVTNWTFAVCADIGDACMYMLLRTLALAIVISVEIVTNKVILISFPLIRFVPLSFNAFHLLLIFDCFVHLCLDESAR